MANGIGIRNFTNAQGGVFYNGGVPYDADGALLVNSLGSPQAIPALAQTVCIVGDSFAANTYGGSGPGGLTFTRSSNVVTVTGATSHKMYPGSDISVVGLADAANEVQHVPVIAVPSSSSFTYASVGADGVLAERSASSGMVMLHSYYQSAGFWPHFNRLTNGAYRLVNVCGFPGAPTDVIADKVPAWVNPYTPDRCVYFAGYNDLTAGYTVAQTVANIKEAVDAYPSALWDVFSTAPFLSGAANNTAANLVKITQYYLALKEAFADYTNVRVHNSLSLFGLSTGLAKTGYIQSDDVHPTERFMYEAAKYIVALDAVKQTALPLPCTALDTYAIDSSSKHLVDNPLMGTSVASTLTNVTGNMPTGASGALSGTGASGVGSLAARSDGFGNEWVVTYTPANADNTLRMSFSIPAARFTSGGTIKYIGLKASVSGVVAGNIKNNQVAFVWICDGNTYASSVQECGNSVTAAAMYQQDDVVDLIFSIRDVPIPVFSSLTTARLDFTIAHIASGTQVVAKISQADLVIE